MYVPKPAFKEHLVFCALAFSSMVAGTYLCYLMFTLRDPHLLWLSGLVHSLAFGGMLWFIRFGFYRSMMCICLCFLFSLMWVTFELSGSHLLSLLLCPVVWGTMLWRLLEDAIAFVAFVIIAVLNLGSHITIGIVMQTPPPTWFYSVEIGYWFFTSTICFFWFGYRYRFWLSTLSKVHCVDCGYPLDGLDTVEECPECGTSRPLPIFRKATSSQS